MEKRLEKEKRRAMVEYKRRQDARLEQQISVKKIQMKRRGGGSGGGSGSGSGGGEQKTVSKLNPYFSVVEMSSVNIKNNKNKKNCADDELPTVMPFG